MAGAGGEARTAGEARRPSHHGLGRLGIWTWALDAQPMREAQRAAAALEEMGFGTVWVPEAVGREPFASCALLLSATERLTMATGIASMQARSAATMASGWRTLTERFGERFLLGIGTSHQHLTEKVHRGRYEKPYSAMVEYLDAMDAALYLAAPPTVVPRRVLAALGPRMLALSGRRGLGAHPYFVPVEHTAEARRVMGPDALLAPEQAVVLSTDAGVAREIGRKFMLTYNRLPNYANNLRRLGWRDEDIAGPDRVPSDAMVDAIVAWGDMDAITARIDAHFAAGASHVCVQVLRADSAMPMDEWRELSALLPRYRD
jgi:probable F420-dependent oxidoreductase